MALKIAVATMLLLITGNAAWQQHRGLMVIPGLGRPDRLKTVEETLRLMARNYLSGEDPSWDCVVYIYAPRNDTSFWSLRKPLNYVASLCDIVEHPNGRVTDNLYLVQPALIRRSYNRIFILLDDCKLLGGDAFDLQKIIDVMDYNNLTVASPLVTNFN